MPDVRVRSDLLTVPNALSASRFGLAALFPLAAERPAWAVGVLAAAAVSDVLDGWLARRLGKVTAAGALIDGLADKAFVLSVVATLLVAGRVSVVEVLLLGAREIGESALLARLAWQRRLGGAPKERRANVLGKLATTLQFATVTAVLLGAPGRELWVGATAAAGVAAAVSYWRRELAEQRAVR